MHLIPDSHAWTHDGTPKKSSKVCGKGDDLGGHTEFVEIRTDKYSGKTWRFESCAHGGQG